MQDRIGQLCGQFKLPTMGAQSVARFTAAGHGDALATFLEVLDRKLRIAATDASTGCAGSPGCPRARPGRPSSTTESPWRCGSNWTSWPRAASSSAASTCWPSGCPAPARPPPGAPWATAWWKLATPSSSLRPTAWSQELLAAKRDLDLPRQLRKLDNFDFLLLDDLGYLPQGAEESEVLFTLIAERYERRSLGITSNLVFSEWERIFANPMATAPRRLIGSCTTPSSWSFDVPSYRTNAAQQRGQAKEVNRQN